LDPHTSAQVIIGHVQDGLELARRYRLPRWIRALVAEHHGTSRAGFQYERAVEQAGDPAWVNEADFRHRGPRPRSRETALVMLADRCEAAVRARRPATPEDLAQVVGEMFREVLETGQLDDCPITLRELNEVQQSFVYTLKGVFHPRLPYPTPAARG
jgi:Predicted membrane-associated HD superfamily hydrolase